jgi:hypothetical protein
MNTDVYRDKKRLNARRYFWLWGVGEGIRCCKIACTCTVFGPVVDLSVKQLMCDTCMGHLAAKGPSD